MIFILTQTSYSHREVDFLRVRNPIFLILFRLIWPGPGFEPVTSKVAGRRGPCILSHLTQTKLISVNQQIVIRLHLLW
jgi:hypothetical protein